MRPAVAELPLLSSSCQIDENGPPLLAARLLLVVGAAVVAGELAHDVVLIGALGGHGDLLALGLEVGELALACVLLLREIDAAARAAQRLREQEIFVAVAALELAARRLDRPASTWRISFSSCGQHIARFVGALAFLHEALLELEADRIFGRPVGGRRRARWRLRRRGHSAMLLRGRMLRGARIAVDGLAGTGRPRSGLGRSTATSPGRARARRPSSARGKRRPRRDRSARCCGRRAASCSDACAEFMSSSSRAHGAVWDATMDVSGLGGQCGAIAAPGRPSPGMLWRGNARKRAARRALDAAATRP